MKKILIALLFTITAVGTAFAQGTPSPEGARVYFANLSDGDSLSGPVKVIFGLSGMGVAPAGIALPELLTDGAVLEAMDKAGRKG